MRGATADLDSTHDPAIGSWVDNANGHRDFPVQNLPFGVFSPDGGDPDDARGGIRIGDWILDLRLLSASGLLTGPALVGATAAAGATLNYFFGLGAEPRRALRARVHELLREGAAERSAVGEMLCAVGDARLQLPATVGDYTDFYAGIHHAVNVGSIFRPDAPLLPNYPWVPIAYHGRASSIRVSGHSFHRPHGQLGAGDGSPPLFAPTQGLDFELEVGVWVGRGNTDGRPIAVGTAARHIAGYCLLNDWSARDIQSWEYQPLGPFLSKSFATTVSPWVITPEALAPFRRPAPARPRGGPRPLPYLVDDRDQASGGLAVQLQVSLQTSAMRENNIAPQVLSRSSTEHLYWTVAQLIAHHTSGGCRLRPGDLLGSGTISAPDHTGDGSLLELTGNGSAPLLLPSGERRTFLRDGDEVILRAWAEKPGAAPIGFGDCRAVVMPAVPWPSASP